MSVHTKICAVCSARCPYNATQCPGCGAGFVLLSPLEVRRSAHPGIRAMIAAVCVAALIGALVYMSVGERRMRPFDRERVPSKVSAAIPKAYRPAGKTEPRPARKKAGRLIGGPALDANQPIRLERTASTAHLNYRHTSR